MRLYWLSGIFLLCSQFLGAQQFAFEQLGTREGLAASSVQTVFQDRMGALWIGTELGVSRFDASAFDHYFQGSDIRMGRIFQIREDEQGGLWMAGERGLFLFQNGAMRATPYTGQSFYFNDLSISPEGGIWIGGGEGLFFLPPTVVDSLRFGWVPTFQLTQTIPNWEDFHFEDSRIQALALGEDGEVFLSTDFFLFSWKDKQLTRLWGEPNQKEDIEALAYSEAFGLLWGCKRGFFQRQNGQVMQIAGAEGLGKSIQPYGRNMLLCNHFAVYELSQAGIRRLFTEEPFELIELSFARADHEGNIWVGSWEGLLKASPAKFFRPPSGQIDLFGLGEDLDGQPLLGTYRGTGYHWTGQAFEPFLDGHSVGIRTAETTDLIQVSEDEYWASTAYEGLLRQQQGATTRFTVDDGIGDNTFFFLHQNLQGQLLAGGDGGLTQIFPSNPPVFKRYHYPMTGSYVVLNSCVELADHSLLLGTNFGVFSWNPQTGLQPVPIEGFAPYEPAISELIQSPSGQLYAATLGMGLLRLRPQKDSLQIDKTWIPANQQPERVWLSVVAGPDQYLWAGSYRQLCRIPEDGVDEGILCFDVKDGFFAANYSDLLLQHTSKGAVWAANTDGLLQFYPDSISSGSSAPQQYLREVIVNRDQSIYRWDQELPAQSVTLTPGENELEFYFSCFSFSNWAKNRFKYRVYPLEKEWRFLTGSGYVHYQQLPPGNFRFELHAANAIGKWSEDPASFSFVILPPVYQRGWFIGSALLLLLGLSFLWRRGRQRRLEKEAVQQTLDYFANSTYGQNTVEEILWDVARNVISRLNFEDCVVYLRIGDVFVQKAAFGPKNPRQLEIINPLEIKMGQGIVGWVGQTGHAEIIPDTSLDERYLVDDQARLSEICVPIKHENRVIGIIDAEHRRRHFFTEDHLKTLQTIAALCANKIVKAQAEIEIREKEQRLLALNQRMAETRLMAVRAQMNPHFIFNSLNSIQECILSEKVDTAYHYLSKFSRLLRLVLDYSSRNFIRLDQEIYLLQLYLELEKMRFGEQFSYAIETDPQLELDAIRIPSLLIQPFVENAIWHGLLPKVGARNLHIRFWEKNEDFFCCTVEDNGIGRAAAMARKAGQLPTEKHESKGMNLAMERLEAISQQTNLAASIEIQDLYTHEGEPSGTLVFIELPAV